MVNRKWTIIEDRKLIKAVNKLGTENWSAIAKIVKKRTSQECRQRWKRNLDPNINRNPFTPEEDKLLLELYDRFKNKWVKMVSYFVGRTDVQLKYRYRLLTKKIKRNFFDNDTLLQMPPQKQQPQITYTKMSQSPQFIQSSRPQITTIPKTTQQMDLEEQAQQSLYSSFEQNYTFDNTYRPFNPNFINLQLVDIIFELESIQNTRILGNAIQEFNTIDNVDCKSPIKNPSSSDDNHGLSFV